MKKILISLIVFALAIPMHAQFFNRLVQGAGRAAENAVEREVDKKVEEGIEKAFNPEESQEQQEQEQAKPQKQQGWTCPACGHQGNTGKFCTECGAKKPEAGGAKAAQPVQAAQPEKKAAEATYAKSDFVRGDEVFFDDDFANEQMGEFPSKWDLNEGSVEVASLNGQKYLVGTEWSYNVEPLMKNQKSWLPDQFTLEFDLYVSNEAEIGSAIWHLYLMSNKSNWNDLVGDIDFWWRPEDEGVVLRYGSMRKPDNQNTVDGEEEALVRKTLKLNAWNHFALSFNKRALKFYLNGTRIFQVPNMMAPEKIQFYCEGDYKYRGYANVILAKGAVPLYNRLTTEGRIITYGITFDIGKATIKPESMTEINRIVKLMNENPDLKFEVQGHTDNTGTVSGNQKLSEERAQAIVAKLVELGISANRLTAVGKGQSSPLADNSTDEGRAKNRRVEFVKK